MFDSVRNSLVVGLIQVMTGWGGQSIPREYPPLASDTIRTEHYEMHQIIGKDSLPHGNVPRSHVNLRYDTYSQTVIATVEIRYPADHPSGRESGIWAVRIDGGGNVLNTLDWSGRHWNTHGILFEPETVMDWVRSGNPNPQPYARVINKDDELSAEAWAEQFRQLHEQADEVYFSAARHEAAEPFQRHRGIGYFLVDSGWVALYGRHDDPDTTRGFNPGSRPIMAGFPEHEQKTPYPFLQLERALQPFHDWEDESPENRLSITQFSREEYHRNPLGLMNDAPARQSGFHGHAAFQLHHNNELLRFSAYAYEVRTLSNGGAMNGYDPDLALYRLPPETPGHGHLMLLNLFEAPYSRRSEQEAGLYVVRPVQ